MNTPTADPRPPTLTEHLKIALSRARHWGRDYAWIATAFTQGLFRRDLPRHYGDGVGHPILLLPGVYEDWTVLRRLADRLNAAGHPIHALPQLRRNTMGIVEGAALAQAYLEANDLREVVVVAHSKGGLIAKQLLATPSEQADGRVLRVITIATPFAGSRLAPLVPHPVVRSLGPQDQTIVSLGARADLNHKIISICPSFDPHIPGGSYLEGATNVSVEVMGHFRVLGDPAVLDAVVAAALE